MSVVCKLSLVTALVAAPVFAQIQAATNNLKISVEHSLLSYDSTKSTTKVSSATQTTKETTLATSNRNVLFSLDYNSWFLRYGLVGNHILAGRNFGMINAGLSLAIANQEIDTPKSTNDNMIYGLFVKHNMPVGNNEIEAILLFNLIANKTITTTSSNASTETKTEGHSIGLDLRYNHHLVGNLFYVAALTYQSTSTKVKTTDAKTDSTNMSVTPLALRYTF